MEFRNRFEQSEGYTSPQAKSEKQQIGEAGRETQFFQPANFHASSPDSLDSRVVLNMVF
jgi:hypothetical protein